MTGIELLIGASAIAGKDTFKKTVSSVNEALSDKAKKFFNQIKTERQIGKLYSQIAKVRKVKTLGQLDRAVDLYSFYCDSHVYLGKSRKKITRISDFGTSENILIEGVAGQGKSIFLRYLCSAELVLGEYIPVFIELRKIGNGESLIENILETLKSYHLDLNEEVLREIADSGRLLLLLDAFDELNQGAKKRILNEIEMLSNRHEKLRILII